MNDVTLRANTLQGVLIILAAVMPVMAIVSLIPILPMLGKEFASVSGSEFLVPAALTIPAFCLAVFSPAAGWLADRIGRKNLLVISLALYSGFGTLPFFLADLKQIIAARFALGIVEAAIMTVATTLIGDYFEGSRRQRWFAIQVASVSVAAVVLVWFGGMLGHTMGSRGPFLLYILALPLALACYLFLYEPTNDHRHDHEGQPPLPWARLAPLILGGFVLGVLFYATVVNLGKILAFVTEPTPQFIGQMSAITNFSMILGTLLFGLAKSRVSAPAMLVAGSLLIALGYLTMPHATTVPLLVFSCAMVTFAAGFMLPTFLTWVMSMLELSIRGRGTGSWQGAFFLGQFIAPIVMIAFAKMFGGLDGSLYILSAIALVLSASASFKLKGSLAIGEQEQAVHVTD